MDTEILEGSLKKICPLSDKILANEIDGLTEPDFIVTSRNIRKLKNKISLMRGIYIVEWNYQRLYIGMSNSDLYARVRRVMRKYKPIETDVPLIVMSHFRTFKSGDDYKVKVYFREDLDEMELKSLETWTIKKLHPRLNYIDNVL